MKKQELIENISKVEQLLNSDTPEAGFELLKTINKSELNEALSDLIQSIVKEKYFTPYGRRPANYSEGLDLLRKWIPNLTSLDLSGTDIDELDLDKFINLQELNISYCGELHTVIGLEKLNKLTSLNCISTDSLLNLDVNKLKLLPNIIGLRDKNGICFGGNIQAREHTWWGYLDDFIDNYISYWWIRFSWWKI